MPTNQYWDYLIFNDVPANYTKDLSCLAVDDIDQDGKPEIVVGGLTTLLWFRPENYEYGVIDHGHFHVSLSMEDVDLDGRLEIVVGKELNPQEGPHEEHYALIWYKPGARLEDPWTQHVIDPLFEGGPHDIVFADVDGDGRREMVSIACYTNTPGIFLFKPGKDVSQPWKKYPVQEGIFTEGLNVGDLDGDSKLEIICGPDWYHMPADGPFSGHWRRQIYAPNFREMCRTALIDISGNGRPDIVITDSEYMDGFLSWFENRLLEDPSCPWIEHRLENGMIYSHSLGAYRECDGATRIFVAEMEKGGWDAPVNYDARLLQFFTHDHGKTWERDIIFQGEGTHQAIMTDIDQDGDLEVVGKTSGAYWKNAKIQIWKKKTPALKVNFQHRFIDRDKPGIAIDIFGADLDGDGKKDVICGSFWYHNPSWERHEIPGIYQAIAAYDIDHDGKLEVIGVSRNPEHPNNEYLGVWSDLWWAKPIDLLQDKWQKYHIGKGSGDWPHGCMIGPILPEGQLALVLAYHDASPQELFEIPTDPKQTPWLKRTVSAQHYSEELLPYDLDHDGKLDIVGGKFWLENLGKGEFIPHVFAPEFIAARHGIADINGDGRDDVIAGQEIMDFTNRVIPFSAVEWFEQPVDPCQTPWKGHIIDTVRCAHSIDVGDIDGDGQVEVIVGEHDPFWPYRKRCRVFVYKKAEPKGRAWYRYLVDGRFEHHDGTTLIDLGDGKMGIISIGWQDKIYVHLWTMEK